MTRRARAVLLGMAVVALAGLSSCGPSANERPVCGRRSPLMLMAESVRSASLVPCVSAVPLGWSFEHFTADERHATFGLEREVADGGHAEVSLTRSCETSGMQQVRSDRSEIEEYGSPPGGARATWVFVFEGGCVRLDVALPSTPSSALLGHIHDAIAFVPTDALPPAADG